MARYFVLWSWSNENVLAVANVKLKVESNLSWVPEKLDKIFTRHVADQILKLLSPTYKITRIYRKDWI